MVGGVTQNAPMNTTYLTTSLLASIKGSEENYMAAVSLAKRDDGTHAVIKRVFPNHRVRKIAFGYQRFGKAVVWVESRVELVPNLRDGKTHTQEPLDSYLVRHFAEAAFKAADEVTEMRKSKP